MKRPSISDCPGFALLVQPQAKPANAVIYALVVALLELEQNRDRGMVRRPMSRKRPE
jgi:hypothetical protein